MDMRSGSWRPRTFEKERRVLVLRCKYFSRIDLEAGSPFHLYFVPTRNTGGAWLMFSCRANHVTSRDVSLMSQRCKQEELAPNVPY